MKFNYFYGAQAEQFSFVRIPRIMLMGKEFQVLSMSAKMLYGVLLDRMSLSMRNGWLDEQNRVYIIYQIREIQNDLGFSKKKAMELLSELEQFGLLQKKRRGRGLPNILYVESFMEDSSARDTEMGSSVTEAEENRNVESRTSDIEISDSFASRSIENRTMEVPETVLLEVPGSGTLKNQTIINNTYKSKTESNPFVSIGATSGDEMRCDVKLTPFTSGLKVSAYQKIIHENIGYDDLLIAHPTDRELIEGIAELILETVIGSSEEVLIASNRFPAEIVRSRFLKLDFSHIEYVLHCLKKNTTKVKNIRKYLLAALFNAPATIEGYYQSEVNHDMPQFALP